MVQTKIESKLTCGKLVFKPSSYSNTGALKSMAEVVLDLSVTGNAGDLARFVTQVGGRKLWAKFSRTLDGVAVWEGVCYLGNLSVKPPKGNEEHSTASVAFHHMPTEDKTESIGRLVGVRLDMDADECFEIYAAVSLWQEELELAPEPEPAAA